MICLPQWKIYRPAIRKVAQQAVVLKWRSHTMSSLSCVLQHAHVLHAWHFSFQALYNAGRVWTWISSPLKLTKVAPNSPLFRIDATWCGIEDAFKSPKFIRILQKLWAVTTLTYKASRPMKPWTYFLIVGVVIEDINFWKMRLGEKCRRSGHQRVRITLSVGHNINVKKDLGYLNYSQPEVVLLETTCLLLLWVRKSSVRSRISVLFC